jgi:hypothetical protein
MVRHLVTLMNCTIVNINYLALFESNSINKIPWGDILGMQKNEKK